jgi:hypothetical protein
MRGLDPRIHLLRPKFYERWIAGSSGNDDLMARMGLDPRIHLLANGWIARSPAMTIDSNFRIMLGVQVLGYPF